MLHYVEDHSPRAISKRQSLRTDTIRRPPRHTAARSVARSCGIVMSFKEGHVKYVKYVHFRGVPLSFSGLIQPANALEIAIFTTILRDSRGVAHRAVSCSLPSNLQPTKATTASRYLRCRLCFAGLGTVHHEDNGSPSATPQLCTAGHGSRVGGLSSASATCSPLTRWTSTKSQAVADGKTLDRLDRELEHPSFTRYAGAALIRSTMTMTAHQVK